MIGVRRPLLTPLVPLYELGLRLKNGRYDRSGSAVQRLHQPVISIGSLSTGGAGKTPVVAMLAHLLAREGVDVDVLSRGYGRTSQGPEQVDAEGTAARFGDEPLSLARAGLKVFVGADRFASGTVAEARSHAAVHLLDDGFQHRKLHRALDIVLLTRQEVDDCLLPAGDLREPIASLARADVVMLREEEADSMRTIVTATSRADIWLIRRGILQPATKPARPLVFCGIARPKAFLAMLEASGVTPAGFIPKHDHYAYQPKDFEAILAKAKEWNADGFCTTAKDAVKITAKAMQDLRDFGALWVAELDVSLTNEATAMRRLRQVLART